MLMVAMTSYSECSSGEVFFQNGETFCAMQCEPVTRCGPFTVPTEHLKVSLL